MLVLEMFLKPRYQIKWAFTTGGGGTTHPSGQPEFTPGFQWVRITRTLAVYVMFCRSLFVLLDLLFLAIVLSVLPRNTDYDYPFGVLKLKDLISPSSALVTQLKVKNHIKMISSMFSRMANVDANTLSWEGTHLIKSIIILPNGFQQIDIIKMLEFLIDNIFVMFDDCGFHQTVGKPMGTNCDLLTDMFRYSHKADFIQGLLKENERTLARLFNFTFRYIDDVLSLHNSKLDDFVDPIYPIEHELTDTKNTARCAAYLDLHIEIDSEGWLRTLRYKKRDDFNFPIMNFPFICSTIPTAPAYEFHISQPVRNFGICGFYLDRGCC
jgi:hypothetical protein